MYGSALIVANVFVRSHHVVVILGYSVRLPDYCQYWSHSRDLKRPYHRTHHSRREPSQSFLHDTADVWQIFEVFDFWQPVAADLLKLVLSFVLNFWKEDHSLYERVHCRRSGVRASFQGGSCNVSVR